MQILKVTKKCSLCYIWNIMRCNNGCQILPVLHLTIRLTSNRCRCCICIHRGCRRTLDTRIHVSTIIITYIYKIMITLHCTRQGLQTDIICSTVTTKGNELVVLLNLSLLLQDVICCLHTTHGSTCIFKCVVNVTILICSIWIHEGRYLQTSGCITDHRFVSFMQSP